MILCSVSFRVQVHSWVARELLPENLTKFSTLILYQTKIPSTGQGWFGLDIYTPIFVFGFFFFSDMILRLSSLFSTHLSSLQILLHAARVRLFKERKMHSVIREIVFYFLFVWAVLLIAYGHRDPYAHFMTQNMENTFVGRQESPGGGEDDRHETTDKHDGDDIIKLADVSTDCRVVNWCVGL